MPSPSLLKVEPPLGRELSSLGKGYLQLLRTKLSHLDIDRNYFALVLIETTEGKVTQQDLAVLLDTDKVTVVRVVDYLSEKGYVKRLRKTDDRRKYNLILTKKAKMALPGIKKSFVEMNRIAFKGFTDEQISVLEETLKKIHLNLTENTHIV